MNCLHRYHIFPHLCLQADTNLLDLQSNTINQTQPTDSRSLFTSLIV